MPTNSSVETGLPPFNFVAGDAASRIPTGKPAPLRLPKKTCTDRNPRPDLPFDARKPNWAELPPGVKPPWSPVSGKGGTGRALNRHKLNYDTRRPGKSSLRTS